MSEKSERLIRSLRLRTRYYDPGMMSEDDTDHVSQEAASHIEAQDKLIAELLEAVLSMVYEDRGTWKVGVNGDYEAPEEVLAILSKALSQKDTP